MTERLRVRVIGTGFIGPHPADAVRRTGPFADGERAVRFVDAVLRSSERGAWERL